MGCCSVSSCPPGILPALASLKNGWEAGTPGTLGMAVGTRPLSHIGPGSPGQPGRGTSAAHLTRVCVFYYICIILKTFLLL